MVISTRSDTTRSPRTEEGVERSHTTGTSVPDAFRELAVPLCSKARQELSTRKVTKSGYEQVTLIKQLADRDMDSPEHLRFNSCSEAMEQIKKEKGKTQYKMQCLSAQGPRARELVAKHEDFLDRKDMLRRRVDTICKSRGYDCAIYDRLHALLYESSTQLIIIPPEITDKDIEQYVDILFLRENYQHYPEGPDVDRLIQDRKDLGFYLLSSDLISKLIAFIKKRKFNFNEFAKIEKKRFSAKIEYNNPHIGPSRKHEAQIVGAKRGMARKIRDDLLVEEINVNCSVEQADPDDICEWIFKCQDRVMTGSEFEKFVQERVTQRAYWERFLDRALLQEELLAEEDAKESKKVGQHAKSSKARPKVSGKQSSAKPSSSQKVPSHIDDRKQAVVGKPMRRGYQDPHFEMRPGVKEVKGREIPQRDVFARFTGFLQRMSEQVVPCQALHSRVTRWEDPLQEEVRTFSDQGRRRYENMSDEQLHEQVLRHSLLDLQYLLSNEQFIQNYAVKTEKGLLIKADMKPFGRGMISVGQDINKAVYHLFFHSLKEILQKFSKDESISQTICNEIAKEADEQAVTLEKMPPAASKPEGRSKVTWESQSDGFPSIQIHRQVHGKEMSYTLIPRTTTR